MLFFLPNLSFCLLNSQIKTSCSPETYFIISYQKENENQNFNLAETNHFSILLLIESRVLVCVICNRVSIVDAMMSQKRKRRFGAVYYCRVGVGPITAHSLQWISIISSVYMSLLYL